MFFEKLADPNFMIIAVAQDTEGLAAAAPWYEKAGITYVGLVDETHRVSALYNLVNVPSAVWIDERGIVRRIDEGTYAVKHKMGEMEFGRDDYAPMVAAWVRNGSESVYVRAGAVTLEPRTAEQSLAEPAFRLGVYFQKQGDLQRADRYWQKAQALNPDSWNYHRQDWAFTPDEASANWAKKFQSMEGKPYYRPIEGLDQPIAEPTQDGGE